MYVRPVIQTRCHYLIWTVRERERDSVLYILRAGAPYWFYSDKGTLGCMNAAHTHWMRCVHQQNGKMVNWCFTNINWLESRTTGQPTYSQRCTIIAIEAPLFRKTYRMRAPVFAICFIHFRFPISLALNGWNSKTQSPGGHLNLDQIALEM